jgi:deoxyribonuclease I
MTALLIVILSFFSFARVSTFHEAKSKMMNHVYYDHRKTFYCHEDFDSSLNVTSNRQFKSQSMSRRSHRVEWEHVVPAENFGRHFGQWRMGDPNCVKKNKFYKGRKCARKMAEKFRLMEADPFNLVPAIGEVNQARSNFRFAELPGEEKSFGICDFKISQRRVAPRQEIKGDIARIYYYMEKTYGLKLIANSQVKLFEAWNKIDPIDDWECKRIKRIRSFHPESTGVWQQCH